MEDMLAVEGQLDAVGEETKSVAAAESEGETASGHVQDGFHSNNKKTGTWKRLKKAFKTTSKESELHAHAHQAEVSSANSHSVSADPVGYAASEADDAASELAPSEIGRGGGSRMSMRYELAGRSEGDDGKGTLKGMFKPKNKKSKQIELDALRFEMGNLQEKIDTNEREVATYQHEVGILTTERDHFAHQVHDLTQALQSERAERDRVEYERDKLKEQNSQVKSALEDTYSKEQELRRKKKELEELAAAQQNSLEEAEERYRDLQQEHDELHHTALAAKAQLVTAQAQLTEARTQREELLAELTALTNQTAALQSEIDSRDEKMSALERDAEQANDGLESALVRLRELEAEQQQLESRVALLQEENLELSTELAGVTELKRQLGLQLADVMTSNTTLQAQLDRANVNVDTLTARLNDVNQQLEKSSELGGSLRLQNTELLNELAVLREQQQAKSKSGSPLSKWRIASGAAKPLSGTAQASVGTAAAGNVSSNGATPAGSDGTGFSPMTRQLPTTRANTSAAGVQGCGEDDVAGQVYAPAAVALQADSSCTVTATDQPGSPEPVADAAAANSSDDDLLIAAAGTLKPPIPSNSLELSIVKGPLTASRPTNTNRRPASATAVVKQGPGDVASKAGKLSTGPKKQLFSGNDVADSKQVEQQQPQSDFFARLFGCFAPQVEVR